MVVALFSLSRLGYTVMMLSPRLSASACVSLLDQVGCRTVLYSQTDPVRDIVAGVSRLMSIACRPTRPSSRETEAGQNTVAQTLGEGLPQINDSDIAVILHSSGSTGTPKPLYLSHRVLVSQARIGPGWSAFNTLPWYHGYGLATALQAMYRRKTAFGWDTSLPITGRALVAALQEAQPESMHCVPYVLQLLVDEPDGIRILQACQLVTFGGAACPDQLGDRLVAEGVRFGGLFGSYVIPFSPSHSLAAPEAR